MDDPDIAKLSKRTLKRIDDAFDRAIRAQAASGHGYSDNGGVVAPPTVRRRQGEALKSLKLVWGWRGLYSGKSIARWRIPSRLGRRADGRRPRHSYF
jgi:hypothetical protein